MPWSDRGTRVAWTWSMPRALRYVRWIERRSTSILLVALLLFGASAYLARYHLPL